MTDVTGPLDDVSIWSDYLPGVDIVFHLAAQTSAYTAEEDPAADFRANVAPMQALLTACRGQHSPTVVFAGTVTETGITSDVPVSEDRSDNPNTIYDLHKLTAELYLAHYVRRGDVQGTTLRLPNVYGPGSASSSSDRGVLNMMIRRALRGENLTVYGEGACIRDYVFIEDVVHAFLLAAVQPEVLRAQYFVIGSGEGHSISEALGLVAERVAARAGTRVAVTHEPPPEGLLEIESRNFVADTARFTDATGWIARFTTAEGIDRTIESYVRQ